MPIRDQAIFQKIDTIRDHYHNNINNRYVRKALMMLNIPREVWDGLERFTEVTDYYKIQGYGYKELYEQIHAAAAFVYHARQEILPNIKTFFQGGLETVFSKQRADADRDRILREMAINNFPSNLGVFADMINELYVMTVNLDKADHQNTKPVFERMSELREIGKLLT